MKNNGKLIFSLSLVFLLASCTSSSSSSATGLSVTSEGGQVTSAATSGAGQTSDVTNLSSEDLISTSIPEEQSFPTASIKDLPTKSRTFYQLLIYSFADSNNDGVGDFKGIVDHLDYLENLGVGGIYLSPIHRAGSYHGYDIIDFYSVYDKYVVQSNGVTYDFPKLLQECHKRGIKVILDMVLNHSSWQCSWKNDHPDWYKTPNAFYGMEDFDFDNPALRNEIKNVGKYWLEKGADGFRLDAAKWIYNNGDTFSGVDHQKNYAWWDEFYTYCKSVKDDVYMIAEILSNQDEVIAYYNTKMDSDFNFGMRENLLASIKNGASGKYVNHIVDFQKSIREIYSNGIESSVLSNHDIGRFNQINNLNFNQSAMAGILNVLAPGNSYVYYGEELAMTGKCEGTTEEYYPDLNYRTPMPFSSGKTNPNNYLFGSVPSKQMTSSTYSGKSAEKDASDSSSLYSIYAKTINAKNANPVLYNGKVTKNDAKDGSIASYIAEKDGKSATVFVNLSHEAKALTLTKTSALTGEAAVKGYNFIIGNTLTMMPYSFAIFDGKVEVDHVERSNIVPSETTTQTTQSTQTIEPDDFGYRVTMEKEGELKLHVYNTNGWNKMNCYAWVDQTQYLGGWPGSAMTKQGDWYSITIPKGAANVIFNDGGSNQTVDLFRPKEGEYYFLMNEESGKPSGNWYTVNPLD